MAAYLRRFVSGKQTRFKDDDLKLELNLVYVTDQVIVMGYPASGIEALYRNHRRDVVKFLESRHGNNYWVFNFCPVKENSYDAEIFSGRVSRYPFPDHHPPPLVLIPLVAREIHTWLSGSPERVAVLHCKAGKGRSGMMACAYLLYLDDLPLSPQLQRSYTTKRWAKRCTEEALPKKHPDVSSPISPETNAGISSNNSVIHDGTSASPNFPTPVYLEKSYTDALKDILNFHTARRMKAPTKSTKDRVAQGVRIPSQRRFLYYWALLLAHEAPKHMWDPEGSISRPSHSISTRPKVHLTQMTLRMRDASKIVKAASVMTGRTSANRKNQLWASISKYDDILIDELEKWEVHTRGKRQEDAVKVFKGSSWDKGKMFRSFAQFGVVGDRVLEDTDGKIDVYVLRTMSDEPQASLRHEFHSSSSVLLDREVRVKFYMGQVLMGCVCFIPTFHILEPYLLFTRNEIDFPLDGIIDVKIEMSKID